MILTQTLGEERIPFNEGYKISTTPISNQIVGVGFQMLLEELVGDYGFVLNSSFHMMASNRSSHGSNLGC